MVILKMDLYGQLVWEKIIETDSQEYKKPAGPLQIDSLGQIYAIGRVYNETNKYLFLKVFDKQGNELSHTTIDYSYDPIFIEFQMDENLDIFLSTSRYLHKFSSPFPYVLMHQNTTCKGKSDGQAWVNPHFGTPPYTFQWGDSPVSSDSIVTGLSPDKWYHVTINDNTGLSYRDSVYITEPPALSLEIDAPLVACQEIWPYGMATASASGGTPPYAFLWNDQDNTTDPIAPRLEPDVFYTVSVTDSKLCELSAGVVLSKGSPSPVGPISGQQAVLTQEEYVYAVSSDDTSIFTWMIEGGTISQGQGSHFVTVQWDSTGSPKEISVYKTHYAYLCNSDTSILKVNLITPETLYVLKHQDASCNGNSDGRAWVNAYFGTPPYSYQWGNSPAGPDSLVTGLPPDSWYHVTIGDDSGMSFRDSVYIAEPPALSLDISTYSGSCFDYPNSKAVASATGGTPPYSFLWNDQANTTDSIVLDLEFDIPYTVNLTDSRLCELSDEIVITRNAPSAPGPILGQEDVRAGEDYIYQVDADTGVVYTWLISGGAISFGQGSYAVTAQWDNTQSPKRISVFKTNGYLCSGDTSILDITINTTGNPNLISGGFQVIPNPAEDHITIKFSAEHQFSRLEIFDVSGRLQFQKVLENFKPKEQIDISVLPSGLYIIELKSDQWKIRQKLIIE